MIALLIIAFINLVTADWQLVTQDDFTGTQVNLDNWHVVNEEYLCEGKKWGVKTCVHSNEKNFRLINGTLVLAAIREKHLDGEYISPAIIYRKPFVSAKYEMRSTMPVGKMLHGAFMVRSLDILEPWFPKMLAGIITNSERNQLAEIFSNSITKSSHIASKLGNYHQSNIIFSDFNIFGVEIKSSSVTFTVNQEIVYQVNLTDFFAERAGHLITPFVVSVTVYVGLDLWNRLSAAELTVEDIQQWDCSLMAIDWIRVYQWNDTYIADTVENEPINDAEDSVRRDICEQVMPELRQIALGGSGFGRADYIFFSALAVVLIILVIVIAFYWKLKSKSPIGRSTTHKII